MIKYIYQETAVNQKQLESLIKVLYAAVATVATDQVHRKLAQNVGGWAVSAKAVERLLDLNVLDTLVNLVKTGATDEDMTAEMKSLRRAVNKVVKADVKVDHQELDMLSALSAYLVNNSDTALARATKMVSALNDQDLTSAFAFEAQSQKDFIKPLQKIVQVVTKDKNRAQLTAEESKVLKEKSPEVYKEYLRLRKSFNQVWRDELRNLVFASKKKLIDFKAAETYLKGKNIQHTLPLGFEGMVDANGKIYTKGGREINGMPGPGFSIVMNPDYNPTTDNSYVFTTINDKTGEKSQYAYTVNYRKQANQEKFEKVKNLDKLIEGIRKKWVTQLRKVDKSPASAAATVLEILYQFSARIGTDGNSTGGKATFGITTLRGSNFKVDGDKITMRYAGKKGVPQVHVLQATTPEAKLLVKNIKLHLADKEPKDRVFTYVGKTGIVRPLTSQGVNQYFKKLGATTNVHKLRHVRGTRLFNDLLAENADKIFNTKKPLSETQAIAAFKKLATQVGELLGHVRGVGRSQTVTPATAIANYIDPMAMRSFFAQLGMREPRFLAKFKD